jgi:hypothetical protein
LLAMIAEFAVFAALLFVLAGTVLWPARWTCMAFLFGFIPAIVLWLAHHRIFHYISGYDGRLLLYSFLIYLPLVVECGAVALVVVAFTPGTWATNTTSKKNPIPGYSPNLRVRFREWQALGHQHCGYSRNSARFWQPSILLHASVNKLGGDCCRLLLWSSLLQPPFG